MKSGGSWCDEEEDEVEVSCCSWFWVEAEEMGVKDKEEGFLERERDGVEVV